MLQELLHLESQHTKLVAECRARDGEKGRIIMPDYDTVNPVSVDVRLDVVIVEAEQRARQMSQAISSLT